MGDEIVNKSEFILAAGEYGFYIDKSKGIVSVLVGPYQKSLTVNTESPMVYDARADRLIVTHVGQAQLRFPNAKQGQYIVLHNPAEENRHPAKGSSAAVDLQMGQKIIVPGPVEFPLWPMQRAEIIDGHQLRTDQYLIVQVYDETEAEKNKGQGFTKRVKKSKGVAGQKPEQTLPDLTAAQASDNQYPTTVGHSFIVKGTDVAFYIPPTGYEVVPEEKDGRTEFVRTAVSLERLEYCSLLDENGNRRIEIGPQVVFPEPTENFVSYDKGNLKFPAVELDATKGLHIKVTEDYTEGEGENKKEFKRGEEYFITGKEQLIYFPRAEHAIVSYGGTFLHHGIAIPSGEGRYVQKRKEGNVELIEGPRTYLPNPIDEIVVRRVLTEKEAQLIYPGNSTVAAANQKLRQSADVARGEPLRAMSSLVGDPYTMRRSTSAAETFAGAGLSMLDREVSNSARTITLDSKFEGAVRINVWPGFAVMIVNGKGDRRVVQGPATTLLQYDETLHRFALSTGTPKTSQQPIEGVYLQTSANSVSDLIEVETQDLCRLSLRLSYRVNFEGTGQGQQEKWFAVADYVGLLTTTLRSILRKAAKQHGVLEFLQQAADIVRDILLGKAEAGHERKGKTFAENGMRLYDVDVLDVIIKDENVKTLIDNEQLSIFKHGLKLTQVGRQKDEAEAENNLAQLRVKLAHELSAADSEAKKTEAEAAGALAELQASLGRALEKARAEAKQELEAIELSITKAKQDHEHDKVRAAVEAERLRSEIETLAHEKLLTALAASKLPDALQHVGEGNLLRELSKNLSVQTIVGGDSLVDVLSKFLKGMPIADSLQKLMGNGHATNGNGNGHAHTPGIRNVSPSDLEHSRP